MGNREQVLDKISRNLDQRDIANTRGQSEVSAAGLTITYEDAEIQSPMGGVDNSANPFLGIGTGNPGTIKVKGAGGENTLAAIWTTEERMQILRLASGLANDITVEAGDTTAELARLPGHADMNGLGN